MSSKDLMRVLDQITGGNEEKPARPLPEAEIMELAGIAERYGSACPFKRGDIITPRRNSNYCDAGVPHVVIEVIDPPARSFMINDPSACSSSNYAHRMDLRVVSFQPARVDGQVRWNAMPFYVESWAFEPFDLAAAQEQKPEPEPEQSRRRAPRRIASH